MFFSLQEHVCPAIFDYSNVHIFIPTKPLATQGIEPSHGRFLQLHNTKLRAVQLVGAQWRG